VIAGEAAYEHGREVRSDKALEALLRRARLRAGEPFDGPEMGEEQAGAPARRGLMRGSRGHGKSIDVGGSVLDPWPG
jgi:hypothetical protein